MNTEEMAYQFLETGWFDHEDRPKTVLGMKHLIEKVPGDVFDELLDAIVFAPSPYKQGEVLPGGGTYRSFIYLAPHIEKLEQEDVDFIVAHEFAHAYLRHEQPAPRHDNAEDEADALAVKWGFPKTAGYRG